MATKSNTTVKKTKEVVSTTEFNKLKKQLLETQELLRQMIDNKVSNVNNTKSAEKYEDEDVIFTSLGSGLINISTGGNGMGDIYQLENFGDEISVSYSKSRELIRNNKSFFTRGLIFINDEGLVKKEGLSEVYKNLLDKEGIVNLISGNYNDFEKIFKNMSDGQKNIIKKIIIDKLGRNEKIDMNIISLIDTLSPKNDNGLDMSIIEAVEYNKKLISKE